MSEQRGPGRPNQLLDGSLIGDDLNTYSLASSSSLSKV